VVMLDGGEALDELVGSLVEVPGINASAANHIALRLGSRDAFPVTDTTVQNVLLGKGIAPDELETVSEAWRPWRALATVHLLAESRRSKPDRRRPERCPCRR
jgi:AraC family transcriptional regulator, regulatory protein of adaptative response / DNA-3-methyladenine glycosylase II